MKGLYFLILILLLSLYSCENPTEAVDTLPEVQTLFFPNKEQISQFSSDSITDLADFTTFAQYLKVAQQKACNSKSNLISFKERNTDYNVKSFTECPERRNFGCNFRTTFINIENDLILEYNEVSHELSELDEYLLDLISKEYDYNKSDQQNKLVITITYTEDVSITNFKETLIKIIQTITRIEESQKIHLPCYLYMGTNFMPPPPPPPPMPKNYSP
ncbi:hypothetical protein DSM03_103201 [Leeuwenhoekiella aestuarii]|uniref:Uncharacterized protein n=1 Tax=Leeuwenhoekiella aestuarii TaxID=2249426 RepID=A0A4Q0NX34_9FLAO|nr:hypothetical protein [Leeuwenhoekiella aestuarii]RXG16016.1 hypothetical protein DSM03_103201 [Leeuwenhoekiella aestuarii]RXG16710.1 hypothetical protein DSM04_102291 [Leeuwenhoekiella aestuarii]